MGKQMLKRILKTAVYLVIIVSAVFLLMRLVPDDVYFEKPILYLYPEETTKVTVRLELLGELTRVIVSNVSRRGANDSRHGEFIHKFAHIDAYKSVG